MKKKFIDLYMNLAHSVSQLSSAIRLKVGTVIVKDNIVTYGYNGTPEGWDNNCENRDWDMGAGPYLTSEEFDARYPYVGWHDDAERVIRYGLKTKSEVLHSEANALMKISKSTISSEGATLFCTHLPCIDCAKMIYQAGIFTVYYRDTYKNELGLEFLTKSGVNVTKYSGE
jgi:dCMP deaminase